MLSRSAAAYLLVRGQVRQLHQNAEERRTMERQLRQNQSRLQEANRHLRQLAATDALTGLPNRRMLDASLCEHQHISVSAAKSMSLLMIDIDHFKRVNDTYSHEVGDVVLKSVAEVLRASTREGDMVSRYGGEEFVVLLRDAGYEAAVVQAERLRAGVSADTRISVPVTISIGVATTRSDNWSADVPWLLSRADEALYAAKRDGRNCVRHANLPAPLTDEVP